MVVPMIFALSSAMLTHPVESIPATFELPAPVVYCVEEVAKSPSRRWYKEKERKEIEAMKKENEEHKKKDREREKAEKEAAEARKAEEAKRAEEMRRRHDDDNMDRDMEYESGDRVSESGSERNIIPPGVDWPPR